MNNPTAFGYAPSNGLNMYYEIYGNSSGTPLVLIHGGGSTINTTFGKILPLLRKNRKIVAIELQGHGHTKDIGRPYYTFEDDADDVAALARELKVDHADFLGFSNGANTAMQLAIRHPEMVRKLIVASGFYKRDGLQSWFWEFMKEPNIENMPQTLKDDYLTTTNDAHGLQTMHDKDAYRMINFKDWPQEALQLIKAPTLIIAADKDVMTPEHATEMYRLLPNGHLAILPGGHGEYLGEITFPNADQRLIKSTVSIIDWFLDLKEEK